jgi:hypothetical protein
MGAQSLVVADEMRHLQSYLGPWDYLIGAVVHLVTVVYYNYYYRASRLGSPWRPPSPGASLP